MSDYEVEAHVAGEWEKTHQNRHGLKGTNYSVASTLDRGWHVCKVNRSIDNNEFDTLSEAKLAAERAAQHQLKYPRHDRR